MTPQTSDTRVLADLLTAGLIGAGVVPGYAEKHKYGRLPLTANETWEEVWPEGGTYTFQASPVKLGVSSGDVDDDDADTGAWTVEIAGLDGDYVEQTEIVTLNGQAKVETVALFLRVNRVKVLTAGTTGTNEGRIYVYDTADTPASGVPPTATRIMAVIVAGYGQTQQAIYTIPAIYKAVMVARYTAFTARSNQFAEVEMFVRPFGGAWLQKSLDPLSFGAPGVPRLYPLPLDDDLNAKADIRFRVKGSAAGLDVAVEFDLLLILNTLLDG